MLLRYKPKGLVYISTNSTIGIDALKSKGIASILFFDLRIKGATAAPLYVLYGLSLFYFGNWAPYPGIAPKSFKASCQG